jgi:PAS domain S-box-containing protein
MSIRQKIFLCSLIIVVSNWFLGYAIYKSNQKLIESEQWVHHTEQVIALSVNIYSTAKDIKTASRDFVITNDSTYIKSLVVASKTGFSDIRKLKQLTKDNPAQQQRIDSLDLYMHQQTGFSLKVVEIRSKYGLIAAIACTAAQNNKYYTAPIHQVINDIQQQESLLLVRRKQANEHNLIVFNQFLTIIFILIAGFNIFLIIAIGKYLLQNRKKEKRAAELVIANKELSYQSDEKEKRADELIIANEELLFQSDEKEKRAAELVVANKELLFQSNEKEKRAAELIIANKELLFQNSEKEKRAGELIVANEELLFQNNEKEKRAAELVIANKELSFQNREKEKRAVELAFANEELLFQNDVRKIAEKNLSQSESRLKEAQALARTGNFEVDMINNIEVWSDEMYKIYGIKKKNVTPSKQLFLSFIHPDDWHRINTEMEECARTFQSSASEFRFIRNDGVIRYGYSEARFELDDNRNLLRIYGILQDITDVKLADVERTKMLNDLMIRNNDLEQFAYIVSHNLRAPVANIIGASSALNDVDLSAEDSETLNRAINTSVMRLDGVVQDLNHILQVKGNVNDTREMVCFSELVDDIKESIKGLINSADMEIKYDFSQLNELSTIKPYLYSVFYNLISNSIKYCQPDIPCSIMIESRIVKQTLHLIFTDNGMGIDLAKNKDQVFGLYRRFHPDIEGKGMGLYMVKTQVETLGGKISIKSTLNQGTEFTIELEM